MSNESKIRGEARSRTKPTAGQQGEQVNVRLTQFGEIINSPLDRKALAVEGSYFIAHNTINDASTTLAGHAAPILADADDTMTKPFVFIRVPASSTKLIVLDFIEIEVVTAGATGAQACWAAQLDSGTTRRSSGGSELTIVNPNMYNADASVFSGTTLAMMGGPVVSGAESANVRYLGHGTVRPSIEIAGDIKMFVFGGSPEVAGTQAGQAAAAIRTSVVALPPVCLGPENQFLLALHSQSGQNAAGVYKLRMGWSERQFT